MKKLAITITLLVLVTLPWSASGALFNPTPIYGSGDSGSFSGGLSYTALNDHQALLTIELTNTSPAANQGYLGAFAFLLPDPSSMFISSFESTSPNFNLLYPPGGVVAPPYTNWGQEPGIRKYDAGASISNSWTGLGKPHGGLGAGQSATFTFGISGNNLANFTTGDFTSPTNFAAIRFAGFADGGSDKVVAVPGGGGAAIPEPATILLLGSGLLGLAALRKRYNK